MSNSVGGTSEIKDADENVQAMIEKLKGDAETKTGNEFSEFKAVSYKTQVVAGVNYFVKVSVGDDKYIHIRVFCSLPHENKVPELVEVQQDKTKDDELEYF